MQILKSWLSKIYLYTVVNIKITTNISRVGHSEAKTKTKHNLFNLIMVVLFLWYNAQVAL